MQRKIAFSLTAGVLVLLALELGTHLLLAATAGEWVTHADFAARRALLRQPEPLELMPVAVDPFEERVVDVKQVLHPFLGYVIDPTGHWASGHPQYSQLSGQLGFPINVHDVIQKRGPDRLVIGVFGGSVAAIFGAERELLEAELARYPAFAGREIVVVTLAIAGWKQPQQLMALNWLLALGGELDYLLEIDGFNEVALAPTTNLPLGYSPYYPRGWRFRVGDLDPERRLAAGEISYLRRERARWARAVDASPWRWSQLGNAVWQLRDARLAIALRRSEERLATADAAPAGEYQVRGPMPEYAGDAELYADLVGLWERSSRQMARLSAAAGIHYLQFLQPNQYDPGSKPLSGVEEKRFFDPRHRYRAAVVAGYPLLRERARELRRERIAVVDTTRLFADRSETLYRDACCHYNQEGNRLLAARVAREMDRSFRRRWR